LHDLSSRDGNGSADNVLNPQVHRVLLSAAFSRYVDEELP